MCNHNCAHHCHLNSAKLCRKRIRSRYICLHPQYQSPLHTEILLGNMYPATNNGNFRVTKYNHTIHLAIDKVKNTKCCNLVVIFLIVLLFWSRPSMKTTVVKSCIPRSLIHRFHPDSRYVHYILHYQRCNIHNTAIGLSFLDYKEYEILSHVHYCEDLLR